MKKRIFISILVIIITLGVATSVYAIDKDEQGNIYFNLSKIIKKQNQDSIEPRTSSSSEDIYAQGKDIVISIDEMNNYKERVIAMGGSEKEAEKEAFRYLARIKVNVFAAQQEGITISDEEFEQKFDEYKKMIEHINDPQIKEGIEGFGGEEEYYEYIKDNLKEGCIVDKYFQQRKEEFLAENPNGDVNEIGEDGEVKSPWDSEKERMIQELIDEQDFQIVNE